MPSFCSTATFRQPTKNADGSYTIRIAGDSELHEFNGLMLKDLSIDLYMRHAAPPVLLDHGWHHPLPIGMTKQICYRDDDDIWEATFVFAKDDAKAEEVRNLFEQGLLYASISWDIDELVKDYRLAEKRLREWSLTATPRDTTVINSFNNHKFFTTMEKGQDFETTATDGSCGCEDVQTFSQEQLDQRIQELRQDYEQRIANSQSELDLVKKDLEEAKAAFSELKSQNDELIANAEKQLANLEASDQKYQAIKDEQKATELRAKYSLLLPDGSSKTTPEGVLRDACGNMLVEENQYSIDQLFKIADGLLLERSEVQAKTPSSSQEQFTTVPRDAYDTDPYFSLIYN